MEEDCLLITAFLALKGPCIDIWFIGHKEKEHTELILTKHCLTYVDH